MRSKSVGEKVDFSDQVAIVTGGAQGIGRGIVESFAASGADVAIADVQIDVAEDTADEVAEAFSNDATAVECDVTEYEDTQAMVETVIDKFGQVDFLVNNAGTGTGKPTFMDTEPADWDLAIGVCQYGTLNCTHSVLPHMTERENGVIINFGSDSYKGNDPGLSVYGSAKAANVSFTKTLAHEVGENNVRVNLVSPATTRTPATEEWLDQYGDQVLDSYALNRLGEPEDLADAVTFLCSDAASWITGRALSVNGGYIRG